FALGSSLCSYGVWSGRVSLRCAQGNLPAPVPKASLFQRHPIRFGNGTATAVHNEHRAILTAVARIPAAERVRKFRRGRESNRDPEAGPGVSARDWRRGGLPAGLA